MTERRIRDEIRDLVKGNRKYRILMEYFRSNKQTYKTNLYQLFRNRIREDSAMATVSEHDLDAFFVELHRLEVVEVRKKGHMKIATWLWNSRQIGEVAINQDGPLEMVETEEAQDEAGASRSIRIEVGESGAIECKFSQALTVSEAKAGLRSLTEVFRNLFESRGFDWDQSTKSKKVR